MLSGMVMEANPMDDLSKLVHISLGGKPMLFPEAVMVPLRWASPAEMQLKVIQWEAIYRGVRRLVISNVRRRICE
jgi:hypothetical protein